MIFSKRQSRRKRKKMKIKRRRTKRQTKLYRDEELGKLENVRKEEEENT